MQQLQLAGVIIPRDGGIHLDRRALYMVAMNEFMTGVDINGDPITFTDKNDKTYQRAVNRDGKWVSNGYYKRVHEQRKEIAKLEDEQGYNGDYLTF